MKTIKGDLILEEDTIFEESIEVKGNIEGYFNLKVKGDINAWNINAWNINAGDIIAWDINANDINAGDINAWNINAGDIIARDINAWNINAWNINAGDIICESRVRKSENSKTICRVYIKNKSRLKKKEQEIS